MRLQNVHSTVTKIIAKKKYIKSILRATKQLKSACIYKNIVHLSNANLVFFK